jgi:hypothetical protein
LDKTNLLLKPEMLVETQGELKEIIYNSKFFQQLLQMVLPNKIVKHLSKALLEFCRSLDHQLVKHHQQLNFL